MKKTYQTLNLPIEQPKSWILDVDGTIFIHKSHVNGGDSLVPGFMDFYKKIKPEDFVLILSAREKKYKKLTIQSLKKNKIRFDQIVFDIPKGERVLINDRKPDGTKTGFVLNIYRDKFPKIVVKTP